MNVAFLIGEQSLRTKLAKCIEDPNVDITEFPTASKALVSLETQPYDLIVIHWKVYPGFTSGDSIIDELANIIPNTELNCNLFYWEVALRVIDLIRDEDSPNNTTPIVAIFPDLLQSGFGIGDQLTRDSVNSDLEKRQPITPIFGPSTTDFSNAVNQIFDITK